MHPSVHTFIYFPFLHPFVHSFICFSSIHSYISPFVRPLTLPERLLCNTLHFNFETFKLRSSLAAFSPADPLRHRVPTLGLCSWLPSDGRLSPSPQPWFSLSTTLKCSLLMRLMVLYTMGGLGAARASPSSVHISRACPKTA